MIGNLLVGYEDDDGNDIEYDDHSRPTMAHLHLPCSPGSQGPNILLKCNAIITVWIGNRCLVLYSCCICIVWFIVFVSEEQDVQSVTSKRWVARPGLSWERKRLTPAAVEQQSSSKASISSSSNGQHKSSSSSSKASSRAVAAAGREEN